MNCFKPPLLALLVVASSLTGCSQSPEAHARIAKTHESAEKRAASVEALAAANHQALLADIAMGADDSDTSDMALAKLSDERLLASVAMHARGLKQALAAVDKLSDEPQLARVAKEGNGFQKNSANIRTAAMRKMTDEQLIANIAKHTSSIGEELADVIQDKINNPSLLSELLQNAPSIYVRIAAASRMDDQKTLAEIAMDNKYPIGVQTKAIGKLTDQKLLASLATGEIAHAHTKIRAAAASRLTNQGVLADILKTHTDAEVLQAASKNLTDPQLLWDIAKNGKSPQANLLALDNLTSQPLLADIAKTGAHKNASPHALKVAWRALAKLDAPQLVALARHKESEELRLRAVWQLEDKAALAELEKTAPDARIRKVAAAKLAPATTQETTKEKLEDLVDAGKVIATIQGRSISQMVVELQNMTPHTLEVLIPAGTYFVSKNRSVQNMVSTQEVSRKLAKSEDSRTHTLRIPVACANQPKKIPTENDSFTLGKLKDGDALPKLMAVLKAKKVSFATQQAAVWIVTDNASYSTLGSLRGGAPGEIVGRMIKAPEAAEAMRICHEAGVDIKKKNIWRQRAVILAELPAGELKSWLENF